MNRSIVCEPLNKDWAAMKMPERALFDEALAYSVEKVRGNLGEYTDQFLSPAGKNNNYWPEDNVDWTNGFWSGMIWTAYALTEDEQFLRSGRIHSESFKKRLEQDVVLQHHDIGFLYTPSCVADYKLTGDTTARDTAIGAANRLARLYRPVPGIIQRGGDMADLSHRFTGIFIVDCLMNIPLWYWAAEETGNKDWQEMAYQHAKNSLIALVQDNGAVVQHGHADVRTGELTCDPEASQGKGGWDACWSRGQAWAMYGFALSYSYTKDRRFLEAAQCLTNYYLNRLPDDLIANWDLAYTEDDAQRDTSAAAIAICGMLELASHLPIYDEYKQTLERAALKMLESLTRNYLTTKEDGSNALLKGGVYAYRIDNGINEPCVWGDYYYMEALWRVLRSFNRFW
ncbi:glycoside hydrolase family 88 protein [Paenibacillus sp. J5C_2022]|uniref:glycoside hydrolase family 88 protein n=1 Tax=Paenibacillus sp. J5C2022 TaxID=2977129 RepID=UPI0021D3E258|nr:glycoside hydrolase family 88 protein [Paenibacillus sp. J5C2022]MCU6712105.1 glycoside hydrolase family 88 protein [Paenibacillus sp. J5C2022]